MFHRRLARDYETLLARSEAMIHLAVTDLMARRLTGEGISAWHSPRSLSPSSPAFNPWPRREIASTGTRRWRRSCALVATFGDTPHADLLRPPPQRLPGHRRAR